MAKGFTRRLSAALLAAAVPLVGALPAVADTAVAAPPGTLAGTHFYGERVEYPMLFPVGGADIYFADDDELGFGACRAGCTRLHEGVDVMAPKMTEVYAVANATVSWLGSQCCSVFLQHDDGWWSWYIHLNNDTPGTDDGRGWGIAPGIVPGARVVAGQLIGWVGDSGNAEDTAPHLHFELHDASGVKLDPYPSLLLAQMGGAGVCARTATAPLADLLEPGVTLRKGMQGAPVYELQGFLATRGYQVGQTDGIFGQLTHRAVRAFQRSRGLGIDGIVGLETRAAIAAFTARPAVKSLLNLDGRLLVPGMRGPDVGELKRWLRAAGFDPGPRPFNGVFDDLAAGALSLFQQSVGLPADGRLDSATRAALQRALWLVRPDGCG
jgi:peptidoglycan hydrolase-like protein with peptidoglycan-binding domain